MRAIAATEAKDRLDELLDWVASGEDVLILRDGRPAARLGPAALAAEPDAGQRVLERVRAMRKGVTLAPVALQDLIDEGRR